MCCKTGQLFDTLHFGLFTSSKPRLAPMVEPHLYLLYHDVAREKFAQRFKSTHNRLHNLNCFFAARTTSQLINTIGVDDPSGVHYFKSVYPLMTTSFS